MHNPFNLDYMVFADWESYYDTEYTLKKLSYIEYINSPKFKEFGVSLQINDSDPIWYHTKSSIKQALQDIPWNRAALIGHNLHYDGLVLAKKYDLYPARYIDTLAIARAVLPTLPSHSLEYLADYLSLGMKDKTSLINLKGVLNPTPEEIYELGLYCNDDIRLTYKLYNAIAEYIPIEEYELIDITIRMQTEANIVLDDTRLRGIIQNEHQARADILKEAQVDIYTVRSSMKLADEFRLRGVEPPTKISPNTGKSTYAFAKVDSGMKKLLAHSDPKISTLAKARIQCMSSMEIKRAERFLSISACNNNILPVTLNYYGAHTGRWSGGDKTNIQNLKKKTPLRGCLMAPPGHLVIAADQGQIEARITAWLADHMKLLNDFKLHDEGLGPDVYVIMASHIYNKKPKNITDDERFFGKMCVLGLGYGMGVEKLFAVLTQILGEGKVAKWEVQNMVDIYRTINKPIVELWHTLNNILSNMVNQRDGTFKCISYDTGSIQLPNGMYLQYPFLNATENDWGGVSYEYEYKGKSRSIYGGGLAENIVQALARTVIADNIRSINKKYKVSSMTHDEIITIVPYTQLDEAEDYIKEIMTTPPSWGPNIPLAVDLEVGERYAKN